MAVEVTAMAEATYRPPDGYLTMADAAGQLRVSMVTMRKILNDERLQTYRDPRNGRVRLLRVEDVERLTQPVPEQEKAAA